eukprot:TRINITY_DN40334_c0_g1_i1.p1 TRINITY_DN40334_c0_g1~~TRINITY_DN40334_c0_g1_i1.p1  ORF type:complete len:660 (+),score=204.91 TRINITY_DN40334_c0_g1_i1:57-1982(+)
MAGEYPYRLISYDFPQLTANDAARQWFHRGLAWMYGYNHEEAVRCFESALEADPKCAMAHWGRAYALGPNYNKPWAAFGDAASLAIKACHEAAQDAVKAVAAGGFQELETALIECVALRYRTADGSVDEACGWQEAYVKAFEEKVWSQPALREHADVVALYAEALMGLAPWDIFDWQHGGVCRDGKQEALEKALRALTQCIDARRAKGMPPHGGLNHFLIHLMEQSAQPEDCVAACDDLVKHMKEVRSMEGHLMHMPSHIYIQTGDFARARECNTLARELDTVYQADKAPGRGRKAFYTVYCCHDAHFEAWAAMFEGRFADAMRAAERLSDLGPEGIVGEELLTAGRFSGTYGKADIPVEDTANWFEAFLPTKYHVLVRFGRWDAILAEDVGVVERLRDGSGQPLLLTTAATLRYARTVALAVKAASAEDIRQADREAELFEAAYKELREGAGKDRVLMNNTVASIMAVGRAVLRGELEYRRGVLLDDEATVQKGLDHLRRAVQLDDGRLPDSEGGLDGWVPAEKPELGIVYDEPWGWMMPARHPLGALLLEHGLRMKSKTLIEEARDVYLADLGHTAGVPRQLWHPNNVWALSGLSECRRALGEDCTEVDARLAAARERCDGGVKSSCHCRLTAPCSGAL